MKLAYSLGKEVSSQKILHDISNLCNKIPKDQLDSMVLVISLQKIVDLENKDSTPNIEYKQPQS